ncbi:MAG: hypothetical protein JWM41_2044 [Gemmatimonadetes bacterium]|nr:hypothetical protein [Gemmatimonadota bacterium]
MKSPTDSSQQLASNGDVRTPGTSVTPGDEPVDVEEFATRGHPVPKATRYRIRVDRSVYIVNGPNITGREVLEVSNHVPVEHWRLDERFRGGATKKVELNEVVDLTTAGLERFMTLPLDQTEGARPTGA